MLGLIRQFTPRGFGQVRVPQDMRAVTRIDTTAECRQNKTGLSEEKVGYIWSKVEQLYRSGMHPAITLVLRRHGNIAIKRSIGTVHGRASGETGAEVPLTPDSPVCLFSASKVITALLVHKLVDGGQLTLEDRVSDYIPEFAAEGKGSVTVRQLLAHRAGIPSLPMEHPDPELLRDWDFIVRELCAAKPLPHRFQKQAYHALTSGFILGELVRRVGDIELPDALREWIAAPLGCSHLTYGIAPELSAQVPPNVCTGPRPIWPLTSFIKDVVSVPFEDAVAASNSEVFHSSIVPAGNIYASADDASRVFQMLLNGGELGGVRIFKPETVAEAVRPIGRIQFDGTLKLPLRTSAGFMLGETPFGLYGPMCRQAFGHLGFITVLCWADPQRDISVALLNTGKSVSPTALLRMGQVLTAINNSCK
ncbi:MAG: serine hydrolase domain-containing protein [Stenotrophobium sp.]